MKESHGQKMNRLLPSTGAGLGMTLIVFAFFAFASWEVNPAEWHPEARAGFSAAGFLAMVLTAMLVYGMTDPD